MIVDRFPWLLEPNILTVLIRTLMALICAGVDDGGQPLISVADEVCRLKIYIIVFHYLSLLLLCSIVVFGLLPCIWQSRGRYNKNKCHGPV